MKTKNLLRVMVGALLYATAMFAQSTGTTTVSVAVAAEASLSVTTSTTNLTNTTAFTDYTGSTNLTYKIRTTPTTGTGSITAQVTTDFSPTGGPSVASPPSGSDTFKYTCTVASPGTACSGSQTASTSSATSVATFGAAASSSSSGNSASVNWTLPNDPAYHAGSYSATVTFTISAA